MQACWHLPSIKCENCATFEDKLLWSMRPPTITTTSTTAFQPSCFHCMCGKLPALTGQPEHITCCKCGERLAVNVGWTP